MMMRRPALSNLAAALAVVALVLHMAVVGIADAAASTLPRDALGNPICATDADGNPVEPSSPAGHRHLPDCCFAGCAVAGGALLSAGAALAFPPLIRTVLGAPMALATPWIERERAPAQPRAPPPAA